MDDVHWDPPVKRSLYNTCRCNLILPSLSSTWFTNKHWKTWSDAVMSHLWLPHSSLHMPVCAPSSSIEGGPQVPLVFNRLSPSPSTSGCDYIRCIQGDVPAWRLYQGWETWAFKTCLGGREGERYIIHACSATSKLWLQGANVLFRGKACLIQSCARSKSNYYQDYSTVFYNSSFWVEINLCCKH